MYEENLNRHLLNVHKLHKCQECNFESTNKEELEKHLTEKHDTNNNDIEIIEEKKIDDNEEEALECHLCPFLAVNETVLLKHVLISHRYALK